MGDQTLCLKILEDAIKASFGFAQVSAFLKEGLPLSDFTAGRGKKGKWNEVVKVHGKEWNERLNSQKSKEIENKAVVSEKVEKVVVSEKVEKAKDGKRGRSDSRGSDSRSESESRDNSVKKRKSKVDEYDDASSAYAFMTAIAPRIENDSIVRRAVVSFGVASIKELAVLKSRTLLKAYELTPKDEHKLEVLIAAAKEANKTAESAGINKAPTPKVKHVTELYGGPYLKAIVDVEALGELEVAYSIRESSNEFKFGWSKLAKKNEGQVNVKDRIIAIMFSLFVVVWGDVSKYFEFERVFLASVIFKSWHFATAEAALLTVLDAWFNDAGESSDVEKFKQRWVNQCGPPTLKAKGADGGKKGKGKDGGGKKGKGKDHKGGKTRNDMVCFPFVLLGKCWIGGCNGTHEAKGETEKQRVDCLAEGDKERYKAWKEKRDEKGFLKQEHRKKQSQWGHGTGW